MPEQSVHLVEHWELAHDIDGQVEGGNAAEDDEVRVNSVVTGGVPDLDVGHDDDHAVDVRAGEREGRRLPRAVVEGFAALEGVEADYLEHQGLASAVKDPPPETILSKVQVYNSYFQDAYS